MLTSTLLVLLMVVPGLALFYGGLVRSKNVLSVLSQILVVFSLVLLLWVAYGYSAVFSAGNPFFGSFTEFAFLKGFTPSRSATHRSRACRTICSSRSSRPLPVSPPR